MEELLKDAKQFLSIVETATLKDEEIRMLIAAGKAELERAGVKYDSNNSLVKLAIMTYVKAHFGNVNVREKEFAERSFNVLEQSLSLSSGYKKEVM